MTPLRRTRPDLRSAASAPMLSAESAGWALNTLAVGCLSDAIGLRAGRAVAGGGPLPGQRALHEHPVPADARESAALQAAAEARS